MVQALSATDIGIRFGGLQVLDGVSLHVQPGEIVGLIGPNGAGKTTLLDCLSGFLTCRGRVEVAGRDVTDDAPHRRAAAGLGRSFQDARIFPTMTVVEAMKVSLELHEPMPGLVAQAARTRRSRRGEAAMAARVTELITQLGLADYRNRLVRELSTGTRRIVDLACVLAMEPTVVLLDEPSSGIAQREAEAMGPLLRSIRDVTGAAMLVVEHDMPLLLGMADRLYALETGSVIAEGDPAEVIAHPEVVRSYLGDDLVAVERSGSAATRTGGN